MTAEELAREHADADAALNDPDHPHYNGIRLFIGAWHAPNMTEQGRDFMRKVAPYMFRPDGTLKEPRS